MDDFLNIEPTSQNENLSASINIENIESGRDLATSFKNAKNAGEKVELFFVLAENKPEVAVSAFAEIWHSNSNLVERALAMQGLGKIFDPQVKQALAACDTEEGLQVLRNLADEVKGKGKVSNDLTRWAAAWAIENIGFPRDAIYHLEGGAFPEEPQRIRKEIVDRQLEEIKKIDDRRNAQHKLTARYERYLEFWLFGPTQELFLTPIHSPTYKFVVWDVLNLLHLRGVDIGLDVENEEVQKKALKLAEELLKESSCTEKKLYERLERFLSDDYRHHRLQQSVARLICKMSEIDQSNKARAAFICKELDLLTEIGEPSYPYLKDILDNRVTWATEDDRWKALDSIKISVSDIDKKLNIFVNLLFDSNSEFQEEALQQLDNYKSEFERQEKYSDLTDIIKTLLIKPIDLSDLKLFNKNSSKKDIEDDRQTLADHKSRIDQKFNTGISKVEKLSIQHERINDFHNLKEFIEKKRAKFMKNVDVLDKKILDRIQQIEYEDKQKTNKLIRSLFVIMDWLSKIKEYILRR